MPRVVFVLVFAIFLQFSAMASFLSGWTDPIYNQIKNETIKQLKFFTQKDIQIKKAGGFLAGEVVFEDVTIQGIGQANKVKVNYNLVSFAMNRDIVAAISKVTIIDGKIQVVRDQKDQWNVLNLFPQDPSSKVPPPAFVAKIFFENCKVNFRDELGYTPKVKRFSTDFDNVAATLNIKKHNKLQFKLSAINGNAPLAVSGFFDPNTNKFDIKLNAKNFDLKKWGDYAIALPNTKIVSGTTDIELEIKPAKIKTWPLSIKAQYSIKQAELLVGANQISRLNGLIKMDDDQFQVDDFNLNLYNQNLSGKINFSYKHPRLKLELVKLTAYKGNITGICLLDLSKTVPNLNLDALISNLDLSQLGQNTPGIGGKLSGRLVCQGPINDLSGNIDASLKQASLLGQPIDKITAAFKMKDNDFYIERLLASSASSSISLSGLISKDLSCNFNTSAKGIRLSGKGIFGPMSALVDTFSGNLRFKVDEQFLRSPLKHLTANGEIALLQGFIGQQQFEQASGSINIGSGIISLNNIRLKQRESQVLVSGQTGIGTNTQLIIAGNHLNLEDLKIINHLTPDYCQDPKGILNLNLIITGALSAETKIVNIGPLLTLSATGEANVVGALVAEVPIDTGILDFSWKDRRFSITRCELNMAGSSFKMNVRQEKDNQIRGNASANLKLGQFKKITEKYGVLDGRLALNLQIKGSASSPQIITDFQFNDLFYNNLAFDKVSGAINYAGQNLVIAKPINLVKGNNSFALAGNIIFSTPISLKLNLDINQCDVASMINIADKLQAEYYRRFSAYSDKGFTLVRTNDFTLPNYSHYQTIPLYSRNPALKSFLPLWEKIYNEIRQVASGEAINALGGSASGKIKVSGRADNLSGSASLKLEHLTYSGRGLGDMAANLSLANHQVRLNQLELKKDEGKLLITGEAGFNGQLDLDVIGQNLSLDYLNVFFSEPFMGKANLIANITGQYDDPDFSASATFGNFYMGEIGFNSLKLSLHKTGHKLNIQNFSLDEQGKISRINGIISLNGDRLVNLNLDLSDNALGLINLVNDQAKWKKGQAMLLAKVGGRLDQLVINGDFNLKDATFILPSLKLELTGLTCSTEITNSQLALPGLTGMWQSEKVSNSFTLKGGLDLGQVLDKLSIDLSLAPKDFYISLPNLYKGNVKIRQASLSGPIAYDLSQGPKLSLDAELDNAVIYLSNKPGNQKMLPVLLDIGLKLKKNVYAVMGDVWTTDLSNLFMNLELNTESLKISGLITEPSLQGRLTIKRGNLSIFNREFELLSLSDQQKYYPMNAEKTSENMAVFTGEKGKEGILPEVKLMAKTEVENTKILSNKQSSKEKVIVLARLTGQLGAKDAINGLKISFAGFKQDNAQYTPLSYSEQDLKVMLLPDFIKSLTGISKDNSSSANSNAVVADYLNSRLQAMVFRGIERKLEQDLGLESLTLEYNFGKDIRNAMGVAEDTHFEQQKPNWRVGFVKGFFDRFFIDVRYAQNSNTQSTRLTNYWIYQLTYKLDQFWSIMYYREPIDYVDSTNTYSKITLQGKKSF